MDAADQRATVCAAIVAMGWTPRLERCLDALTAHRTRHEVDIVVVVNPVPGMQVPAREDVKIITPEMNLGWAGGLHLARAHTSASYLAWVQDDMEVEEGWLDALVDAAEAHPEIAAFGSLMVAPDGHADGFNGGRAEPPDDVAAWNHTDGTRFDPPSEVTVLEWIASKGMLVRTEAWDEVGGPDPRSYPLNHVDKEFCTHLRAHGLNVALVPDAHLLHAGSQSSPSDFRRFLNQWQEPRFNLRWGPVVRALREASPGVGVSHLCNDWRAPGAATMQAVESAAGGEASRMLVSYAIWQRGEQERAVEAARREADARAEQRILRYAELAAAVQTSSRTSPIVDQ